MRVMRRTSSLSSARPPEEGWNDDQREDAGVTGVAAGRRRFPDRRRRGGVAPDSPSVCKKLEGGKIKNLRAPRRRQYASRSVESFV